MKINIVLLIDNSSIVCNQLISMLMDNSCSEKVVLHATSFNIGLQVMEEFSPDYVLINITDSHSDEKNQGTKIGVITNIANKHYKDFCESVSVNYFLDNVTEVELIPGIITEAEMN